MASGLHLGPDGKLTDPVVGFKGVDREGTRGRENGDHPPATKAWIHQCSWAQQNILKHITVTDSSVTSLQHVRPWCGQSSDRERLKNRTGKLHQVSQSTRQPTCIAKRQLKPSAFTDKYCVYRLIRYLSCSRTEPSQSTTSSETHKNSTSIDILT